MVSPFTSHPILGVLEAQVLKIAAPANLSYIWNFGSLLGGCLIWQILSGLFLAMHYRNDISSAFERVAHIIRDVNYGWLLRIVHANGASLFFILLYSHLARGVYYASYKNSPTWIVGVGILLIVQAIAFLGYVLPWGQISFWGATVITNLVSSIPVLGQDIVLWLWGGFSVDGPTLRRFFALHYLLPFVLVALVGAHLIFLHEKGSSNPAGLPLSADKLPFHPYYSVKDALGFALCFGLTICWRLWYPWVLGDPENFLPANPSVTPQHIQPEWYFLFVYAILRTVPNKLGGVIALVIAILIFAAMPFIYQSHLLGVHSYPVSKIYFWTFVVRVMLLTWIGARPVKEPYISVGQGLGAYYFAYFFVAPIVQWAWDQRSNLSH